MPTSEALQTQYEQPQPEHETASLIQFPIDPKRDHTIRAIAGKVPNPSPVPGDASWLEPYEPYDYEGASNGKVVLNEAAGNLYFSSMGGRSLRSSIFLNTFYCGGSNPPPACNSSGGFADHRFYYDSIGARWIISSLYDFGTPYRPVPVFLAVSQTSDPTGSWNIYQIPACGPDDTTDASDQPQRTVSDGMPV